MKQYAFYAFVICCATCLLNGCNSGLKVNDKFGYQIVVSEVADSTTQKAAQRLQQYLFEMSSEKLPIMKENEYSGSKAIFLGQTKYAKSLHIPVDNLSDDGYAFKNNKNDFIIIGGAKKGVLYGVYDLLEYIGCRMYTSEYAYVPQKKSIKLPEDTIFIPQIVYRTTSYSDTRNPKYAEWHKLSSRDEWGLFVHTFNTLVPPSEYMDKHPEYYALRNGKRLPTELCLSNQEVADVLIENLKRKISEKPDLKYWSVSQNDNDMYCLCDHCTELNRKYGGDAKRNSGSMIYFVNKVAKAIPDKMISTLAYWYTREAPDNIIPEPNVNIMLCNIESKRHLPVFETDTAFSRDLKNWGAIAKDILIWDYNIQFSNLVSPFPNLHTIGPNLDFFTANHVNAFYMQSNSQIGGEMAELRAYLISKLLWNPDTDADAIIDDFVEGYYGAGGQYIRQYINKMIEALLKSGYRLDIFGSPENAKDTYLASQHMDEYNQLFDKAEKAVEDDPVLLEHVKIARLPIMYAQIQISRSEVDTKRSLFNHEQKAPAMGESEGGKEIKINPVYKEMIQNFVNLAKKQGVNRLRERSISPDEYLASYERVFKKVEDVKSAVSLNKTITAITKPNQGNNGIEALTDGIFGGYEDWRDVRNDHWVGYSKSHIDFVLDLGEIMPIKYLNMDFFDAKDTWYAMQLPEYVTYSISEDGKNYTDVAKVVNPTDPNEPEIDSMPRVIYIQPFTANVDTKGRYVKVHAESILTFPSWHVRAGSAAVMYCDEIVVK